MKLLSNEIENATRCRVENTTNASATIYVTRDGIEDIQVEVEGRYTAGCQGRRANKWDRFAQPDEPDEVEIHTATIAADVMFDSAGNPTTAPTFKKGTAIELTEAETRTAEDAILDSLSS